MARLIAGILLFLAAAPAFAGGRAEFVLAQIPEEALSVTAWYEDFGVQVGETEYYENTADGRDRIGGYWADVPAVLVETGFLSSPREAALLRSPAYQQRLAGALARATQRFAGR